MDEKSGGAPDWFATDQLPSFASPPVVEVALGLEVQPLSALPIRGLAKLQETWEDRYPVVSELHALPSGIPAGPQFEIVEGLPPIRFWAAGEDGYLVQTQNDRVVLNWREEGGEAKYPGFNAVEQRFWQVFQEFQEFLLYWQYGDPVPVAAEFTYVNRIPLSDSLSITDAIDVVKAPRLPFPGRPVALRFQELRTVDRDDNEGVIQVSINGEPAVGPDGAFLQLNITARVTELDGLRNPVGALQQAHAIASHTFTSVTTEKMHRLWGRAR